MQGTLGSTMEEPSMTLNTHRKQLHLTCKGGELNQKAVSGLKTARCGEVSSNKSCFGLVAANGLAISVARMPEPPEQLWPLLDLTHSLEVEIINTGADDIPASPTGVYSHKITASFLVDICSFCHNCELEVLVVVSRQATQTLPPTLSWCAF